MVVIFNYIFMKSISLTGDLGSGKSTVAKELSKITGLPYYSTGTIQRQYALEHGMNTLEMNYSCEKDCSLDTFIDTKLSEINVSPEDYIFDSRLAWHFVSKSFKVYVTIDPTIAAKRVLNDKSRVNDPSANEVSEVVTNLIERKTVENRRFKTIYGVDCSDINNFHLIIDSSYANINSIVEVILNELANYRNDVKYPKLWCSPISIYPMQNIREIDFNMEHVSDSPIQVVEYKGKLYAWDGHHRLSKAIRDGYQLVNYVIVAKDGEEIIPGLTVDKFVETTFKQSWVYDWEDAHNINYPTR